MKTTDNKLLTILSPNENHRKQVTNTIIL